MSFAKKIVRIALTKSIFYEYLSEKINELGGYHNAHLHLDRSHTLRDGELALSSNLKNAVAHLALNQKHQLISEIHQGPGYENENLRKRFNKSLDTMVACNTRRADSVIDVTADGLGLRALETALEISKIRAHEIDFRVGVYSPLGFTDSNPEHWELIEEGAEIAHFIGCLPEKDDRTDYPNHIGYEACCRRMIDLARRHNKSLQVHTDQVNHPNECGTERLLNAIEAEKMPLQKDTEPTIWAVHMISPSTYEETRWSELVERLSAANVGVICCPSAAVGMRQLRGVHTPTGNSIARVLELCAAGIQVRLGSDNIADMLSPSTTADLTDEVFLLSAVLRFYNVDVLAKLACGQKLNEAEVSFVRHHIEVNNVEMDKAMRRWNSAT